MDFDISNEIVVKVTILNCHLLCPGVNELISGVPCVSVNLTVYDALLLFPEMTRNMSSCSDIVAAKL